MKYDLVLFDLDGTLFDYKKAEKYALTNAFADFGINDLSAELTKKYQDINHEIWQKFEQKKITSVKLRTERFKILFEQEAMDFDPVKFSQRYLYHLSQADFYLPKAKELIKYFHGKVKMALITNGLSDVQQGRYGKSDIKDFVPHIFISEEIGIPKPHPEIFEFIFEQLNFNDKEKALIVGDSLNSDIQGGNNFGIDSVWFNQDMMENTGTSVPTYEINDLNELKKIVSI